MPENRLTEIRDQLPGMPAEKLAEIERICDSLKVAVVEARELAYQRYNNNASFAGAVRHAREMHTLLLETMLPLEPIPQTVRHITDAVGSSVLELEELAQISPPDARRA
jgi:hypothetical protein